MQLSLLQDNELSSCVLPEKRKGQFWITHRNDYGKEERLIGIEGVDGRWIMKSNRNAQIVGPDRTPIKEVAIDAPSFYTLSLSKGQRTAMLYAEPVSEDRRRFRKVKLPAHGSVSIGRAESSDIRYASAHVSSRHAELSIVREEVSIEDSGSANGLFVNGERVRRRTLKPGDVVYVLGLKLVLGKDFIAINNPDGLVTVRTDLLPPYGKHPASAEEEDDDPEEWTGHSFFRSPRFKRDIRPAEIRIDPPPAMGNHEPTPLMLMLGPSITMGMSAAFVAMITVQNSMNATGGIRNALPSLVMSSSMLVGAFLWPLLSRKHESKKRDDKERLRQSKYAAYLKDVGREIAGECAKQSEILRENHVGVDDCVLRIRMRQRNLWERVRGQNDFLNVRLGIGTLPLRADIDYPDKSFALEDDNLREELYRLAETPKLLEQVPITLSLDNDWISGAIGNRSSVADMVKGILWQLTALHSYDELKLVFLYDKSEEETWSYVKWLPHAWSADSGSRYLATDPSEAKALSAAMEKVLAAREERNSAEPGDAGPHYVVFAMNKELASKADFLQRIYKSKTSLGFSVFHLYDELKHLPKECSMVVEFGGTATIYDKDDTTGEHIAFQPDFYLKQDDHELAACLANTMLDSSASTFALPAMMTFLEMFGVGKIEHLNVMTRWKENDPTLSLEAPIGVGTNGELFKLDLHEKFHGPHGLIAGMTGSGKSEFIMTFILSLAVSYHPNEVAFILIDYKGGGMANAFERLPHLAGTITNLDGAAVKRSLVSIQSELKRRQAIFGETGKKVGASNIDIYKYQKLFREGRVQEPLQHLFIISDEFAELKSQQPEFMEQLVSAARIGRSLGVHLILATQKPSGVVDDQIWSNSKFRICLKVQEKADSMDVIKRPDAAELSVTGRYYVQVGFNELFELGQSAWGGAPYEPADRIAKNRDDSVSIIDNLGRVVKQAKPDRRSRAIANPPKQIDEINKYLAQIADEENIRVRKLWLEPIPAIIVLDEVRRKHGVSGAGGSWLEPVIGAYDDPENQRQAPLVFPISRDGNAIVYGSAGNGKTTFLTTLLYSLISGHTPAEVNLYVLDFGAETLRAFAKAPHVGDVLLADDGEKIANLFKMLAKEVDSRKKRFADYGGDFHSFSKSSGQSVPSIVVAIHNYSAFAETYESLEETFAYLTREGVKFGITFVLTASASNAVRYRLLQNFKLTYVLQMNDKSDYAGLLGRVDGIVPSKFKGRGIFKSDQAYEFQIAHIVPDAERTFEHVRAMADRSAQEWTQAPAAKIPVLPERVDPEFFADELRRVGPRGLPIGIEKSSLATSYLGLADAYIHLALSQRNDSSAFLQGFAEAAQAALSAGETVVLDPAGLFVDAERAGYRYCKDKPKTEEQVVRLFMELVARHNAFKDASDEGLEPPRYEPIACFVSSLSGLTSALSEDAQDKLKVMLEKGQASYGVTFILAEAVSALSSISYEPWFKKHVSIADGIWIGDGISDQYQIKLSNSSSELHKEIGDEFGYRIVKGKATLMKLLRSRTAELEVAAHG
ncbi:type VII secretion protein EssC [Cohnella sp. GCM10027633]|uniref:type VII secretion protein EssC n=1 Tax=unclassified Cohnella TaxID=2636738 RepID=UPI00362675F2